MNEKPHAEHSISQIGRALIEHKARQLLEEIATGGGFDDCGDDDECSRRAICTRPDFMGDCCCRRDAGRGRERTLSR